MKTNFLRKQYAPDPANVFDTSALTLPDEGTHSVSEIVFTDQIVNAPITQFVEVETGVKNDTNIVIGGNFQGYTGSVRDNCDMTPNPYQVSNSQKKWVMKYISDVFNECFSPLQSSFWKYLLANGVDKSNLELSVYSGYVASLYKRYMTDDMMQNLAYFNNTGLSAGVTNSLGAGELKYHNILNGFFAQADVIVGTDADRGVTITENSGATYLLQKFSQATPTNQPVTTYLNKLYFNATIELRSRTDAQIQVTQTVFDQYIQERQAYSNSIETPYMRVENGLKKVPFQGIDVVAMPVWDRIINKVYNNGAAWLKPHRMLFSAKGNMKIATEETSNFSDFRSWFSQDDNMWKGMYGFNFDAKIILDKLIGYGS